VAQGRREKGTLSNRTEVEFPKCENVTTQENRGMLSLYQRKNEKRIIDSSRWKSFPPYNALLTRGEGGGWKALVKCSRTTQKKRGKSLRYGGGVLRKKSSVALEKKIKRGRGNRETFPGNTLPGDTEERGQGQKEPVGQEKHQADIKGTEVYQRGRKRSRRYVH